MANYINNKRFQEELIKFHNKMQTSNDPDSVQANDYIGECILQIAKKAATRWNFFNYTNAWKEEMVDDAIENCIKYGLRNYDPNKYSNPFGYFSLIVWRSFLRRIKLEKIEQYKKLKGSQNNDLLMKLNTNLYKNSNENIIADTLIKEFEDKMKKDKSKKNVKKGLENFIKDE